MKKQSIAVIDSGVGGISVLLKLAKSFPHERFVYFGDNDNAPYGNLSRISLLNIALKNVDFILRHNVKAIVLACNTLSVNVFNAIREYSGLPTFCVFPPVEKCLMEKNRTLLLATERTAKKYNYLKSIDVVGLKDLAYIIEKNIFSLDKFAFSIYFDSILKINHQKGYYKNVILGCTHYNFIKNQIFVHFRPQNMLDGTENLILQMKKHYQNKESSVNHNGFEVLFVGKNAKTNEYIYNVSGQSMCF